MPAGATSYWSAVLGLYLYADGKTLRLHDPETGRINNVEEEIAAREAAEARAAREAARADALESELRALRQRQ